MTLLKVIYTLKVIFDISYLHIYCHSTVICGAIPTASHIFRQFTIILWHYLQLFTLQLSFNNHFRTLCRFRFKKFILRMYISQFYQDYMRRPQIDQHMYSYLHMNWHSTVIFGRNLQLFTISISFNSHFWAIFTVIYNFTVT